MALLGMDPLEEGADLIQCQGGREAARQIHMNFIWTPRGIRAQFANPAQAVYPHPGQGIPSKAALGLTPITAKDLHGLLRIAGRTVKASQSMERVKLESMDSIELL